MGKEKIALGFVMIFQRKPRRKSKPNTDQILKTRDRRPKTKTKSELLISWKSWKAAVPLS